MKQINILIADDHKLVRQTLGFTLSSDEKFTVIAECSTGEEAVKLSTELKPDVVVLNMHVAGISSVEVTEHMCKQSLDSKVLIISQYCQPEYFREIIRAGAMGYLTKGSTLEETKEAILTVDSGKKYICPQMREELADMFLNNSKRPVGLDQLSTREKEVSHCIQKGNTSREIAETLNISVRTVEVHRSNILKKLKLKNSLSLVRYINDNQYHQMT